MTRRIAVFTGTRAEYGLLRHLMKKIDRDPELQLQLIVGAMHLSPDYGETWREIAGDGFRIDSRIEMLLSSDTPVGVVKSMGVGLLGLADALERLSPDMLVLLGDRFETLAAAQAALVLRIPIAHIHGGEVTEGAYDDAMRHAITKMASLHFTSATPHAQRVLQMGAQPEQVFEVGAIGLDGLREGQIMSLDRLNDSLGFKLRSPFILATYHPVTAAEEDPAHSVTTMLEVVRETLPESQVLVTCPNADNGGRAIQSQLGALADAHPDYIHLVTSLGYVRYKSALSHADMVIGNSSSGLIEAPSFGIPTIDIGMRQKGRLAGDSVLHCESTREAIKAAIETASTPEFRAIAKSAKNPYGTGNASARILEILKAKSGPFQQKFYDFVGGHK